MSWPHGKVRVSKKKQTFFSSPLEACRHKKTPSHFEAQNSRPNRPTMRLAILPGSLANHHSRSQIVVDTILPVNSSLLASDAPHKNLLREFPPLDPGQFSRTRAAQRQPAPERLVKPPREGIRIPPPNSQHTSP